jgi:hypothetical protein
MSTTNDVPNMFARTVAASVCVKYRFIEGYHTFTSDDLRGLYVSSKDARKAFNDVPVVLKELIDHKMKASCIVEPSISFDEWLENASSSAHSASQRPLLELGDKRYLVREAA